MLYASSSLLCVFSLTLINISRTRTARGTPPFNGTGERQARHRSPSHNHRRRVAVRVACAHPTALGLNRCGLLGPSACTAHIDHTPHAGRPRRARQTIHEFKSRDTSSSTVLPLRARAGVRTSSSVYALCGAPLRPCAPQGQAGAVRTRLRMYSAPRLIADAPAPISRAPVGQASAPRPSKVQMAKRTPTRLASAPQSSKVQPPDAPRGHKSS